VIIEDQGTLITIKERNPNLTFKLSQLLTRGSGG
jgi:hypothetical protein